MKKLLKQIKADGKKQRYEKIKKNENKKRKKLNNKKRKKKKQ